MKFKFAEKGWEDFCYWLENDLEITMKIKTLLKDIKKDHFKGLGKPEPLKFNFKGCWSRRINSEHRLVYFISGTKGNDLKCTVLQCRFHYD